MTTKAADLKDMLFRPATPEDLTPIEDLIRRSAYGLQSHFYSASQIQVALELVTGLRQLITERSLLGAWIDGRIVACGGWKRNESQIQLAEIRSFFVDPEFARRGIASNLLETCETLCKTAGVLQLHLTATLPGEAFYSKHGYLETERLQQPLSNGETFELVRMSKVL